MYNRIQPGERIVFVLDLSILIHRIFDPRLYKASFDSLLLVFVWENSLTTVIEFHHSGPGLVSPNSDQKSPDTIGHHCQNSHIHHCRNQTGPEAAGRWARSPSCQLACTVVLLRLGWSRCPPSSFLPWAGLAVVSRAGRHVPLLAIPLLAEGPAL